MSFEPELYGAADDELLERLRSLPDAIPSVLVIAHNPGMHLLAVRLAGRGARLGDLRAKYPTAALATLAFPGQTWRELAAGGAELTGYVKPRELE